MVLVDNSVWIDHLRSGDPGLAALLGQGRVLGHPFVLGEIALGSLRQRSLVLALLHDLPQAEMARDDEVLLLVARCQLAGTGIGYVDAHLLCSVKLTEDAELWTRDKRLCAAAERLSIGYVGSEPS